MTTRVRLGVAVVSSVLLVAGASACAPEPVPERPSRYTPRPATQSTVSPPRAGDALPTTTYTNDLFGFSCEFPTDWPVREDDDRSGATATSPDGTARVTCRGGATVSGRDANYVAGQLAAALERDGLAIQTRTSDRTTYRITAASADASALRWGVVGSEQLRALSWDVPRSQVDLLQATMDRSIARFVMGDVGETD
ncbi:MAG: hypothetical protein ACK5LS_05205 [Propioniciclava sp.]